MPTPGTARDAYTLRRKSRPHTNHHPRIPRQKTGNTRRIAPTPRRRLRPEHRHRPRNRRRTARTRRSASRLNSRHQRSPPVHTEGRLPRTSWSPRTNSHPPFQMNSRPDPTHRSSAMASVWCTLRWSPRTMSRTAPRSSSRHPRGSRSGWDLGERNPPASAKPLLAAFSRPHESTRSCGP